jgi:type IV secretion system protein TrbL
MPAMAVDVPASDCQTAPLTCGAQSIGKGIADAVNGVNNAVNTAAGVANFWSDPAGNSFKMMQDGAKGLAENVLPALTHATLPDLTADWFLQAYRVSFALAIFVFVALLIPQIVRTARGHQSGRELGESLVLYGPAFILGAMFGPALGAFLVTFFGALSDSLISWGVTNNAQTIVDKFSVMLSEENSDGLAGGAVLGVILMFFMIIGLLIVLLMLIVQLITLYFSGVLFPLGFVWIVDPQKRKFGSKIAYLWFGILASHPLLFFLLAIAYSMMSAQVDVFSGSPTLAKTVTLVVSILALFMAGLAPLALTKFAPVIPTGGGGAAVAGPTIGSQSMQQADAKYGDSSPSGSPSSKSTDSSSASEETDSTPVTTGGTGSTNGGSGSAAVENDTATSSISEATSPGSTTSGTNSTNAPGGAGSTTSGTAADLPVEAGVRADAATTPMGTAATASGSAAAADTGLAATGAAESSTGVGAAIGIPTMIVAGAKASFDVTKKVTDSVTDAAVAPVEDHEEHYGKNSTHE